MKTFLLFMLIVMITSTAEAQNNPQDYINAHNQARAAVGVGPVSWDRNVAAYAQNYANKRAGDCQLIHSGGPYGENIFAGWGKPWSGLDAVASWVSEKRYYDYNSNTCADGEVCGHYTQVVWANSVRIGCARVRCNTGGYFITCNYNPPGNYQGQWPYGSSKAAQ
nr:pathogenesis-related protein 1k [Allium sativum]QYF06696.1 pathogenesis-related protein 1k [Allium sativum]